jgi:hypothetical protein
MIATSPAVTAPTRAIASFDSISFSEGFDIFLQGCVVSPQQPPRETARIHAGPVLSHTMPFEPVGLDGLVFMLKVRLTTWCSEVVCFTSYFHHVSLVAACARYDLHFIVNPT